MKQWYAMRDLKRRNALNPAYRQLAEKGFEVFTPLVTAVINRAGKKQRVERPFLQDLLFVHEEKHLLDPVVEATPTLQYRYSRGSTIDNPTVVREPDMRRFIAAVTVTENPVYLNIGELTPAMLRRNIRIVGGPLDGYEGKLLTVRGSRVKRLIVEIPGFIAAAVEVEPDYIQLL